MKQRHSRLVDEATRQLEEAILSGTLRPGDRLPVVPLAQQLDMSQSTVREALLMLERRGLVKTRPRYGASVARLSAQEAVDLCRMRALVEAYAVTVGIGDLRDAVIREMVDLAQSIRTCVLPQDLPKIIKVDLAFHEKIAALARSDMLLDTWANLGGRIGALIIRSLELKQLHVEDVVRYHMDVVNAVATRDPAIGRAAIVRHYLRGFDQESYEADAISAAVEALAELENPTTHSG